MAPRLPFRKPSEDSKEKVPDFIENWIGPFIFVCVIVMAMLAFIWAFSDSGNEHHKKTKKDPNSFELHPKNDIEEDYEYVWVKRPDGKQMQCIRWNFDESLDCDWDHARK